jgi:hypothetical protein
MYSWKFYILMAHLTDEKLHTACNRQLPRTDEPAEGLALEKYKCNTCEKFALKIRGKEQKC